MGDHRSVLQAYTEALTKALGEKGVDWIEWVVGDGHLHLDLLPRETFPFQLRVVPGGDDSNCFVEGDLAGVFYMTTDQSVELDKPVVREIQALCEVVLEHIDAAIVEAVRLYGSDDWNRLTRVDYKAIVQAGYFPTAVITVVDESGSLAALRDQVPFALFADDDYDAQFQARNPTGSEERKRRTAYIGTDEQAVERLRELDKVLHLSDDDDARSAAVAEVAELYGTPKCCAKAYTRHLIHPGGEPEHVAFLRHVAQWADERPRDELPPRYPRLTNFLAARAHQLTFIDYWPCSPFCEETIYRNRRVLNDLYDDEERRVVEEILGTSYLGWDDGRLLPFRIENVEGSELRIVDGRRAPWAGLALDRYRQHYCTRIPGGGRTADLRRLARKGRNWRWSDGTRWHRIQGNKAGWLREQPPLVALFGDA